MAADRFENLEGGRPLPDEVRAALGALRRFENLEIGAAKPAPAPAPGIPRLLCLHCGQANEKERDTCWACFKSLRAKEPPAKAAPAQDITLVLDGTTYTSADPALPEDIKVLMDRIRKDGYSQALLAEWRSWRATRHVAPLPERPFAPGAPDAEVESRGKDFERDIRVFRGQRVSVIRLDGEVYTSDDPRLEPEMKRLFSYLETNGVTPALMEYLRQFGSQVKFRPRDTLDPSDGDLAFWKHVGAGGDAAAGPGGFAQREAALELERARLRFAAVRNRLIMAAVIVGIVVLYVMALNIF